MDCKELEAQIIELESQKKDLQEQLHEGGPKGGIGSAILNINRILKKLKEQLKACVKAK
jgi:flagellar biosynthesis chaperone FliJ